MASTTKCLAQSNKSPERGTATKRRHQQCAVEDGTAIVLIYVLVSMTGIVAFLLAAGWSLVGCASAAANSAGKSNQTGDGRALASGRASPCV
jgi:hypothetical protein